MVALDPQSGKVWLIDNKAQLRGIGAADALSGAQFEGNKAAARSFLAQISPHPRASDAVKALDRGDFVKVVSNAWAGDTTRFTKSLIDGKGLAVFDVRFKQLFTTFNSWQQAFVALPRGVHRLGREVR